MSLRTPTGFEDRWRDLRRDWLKPAAVLTLGPSDRARLERLANRAPEVFVRVTSRPKSARALADHLRYISRDGALELQGAAGRTYRGREEIAELAEAWAFAADRDRQSRAQTPKALALVVGLPPGHDPALVQRAATALVSREFCGHDHALVLHTDRPHPHVHATIRWIGPHGHRLPSHRNVALQWRERFAEAVRELGLEVEASPRWARGVIDRAEPYARRLLREQARRQDAAPPRADEQLLQWARQTALGGAFEAHRLERAAARNQLATRNAYLQIVRALGQSGEASDRRLAERLERLVETMPPPLSRRLRLVADLQKALERSAVRGPERTR